MKTKIRFYFIFLIIIPLIVTSCMPSSSITSTPASNSSSSGVTSNQAPAVSIESYTFKPDILRIAIGTTVVWTNNESDELDVHNMVSDVFTSPDLSIGETFEFKFDIAGTFDYYCGNHPEMTGQIIVG